MDGPLGPQTTRCGIHQLQRSLGIYTLANKTAGTSPSHRFSLHGRHSWEISWLDIPIPMQFLQIAVDSRQSLSG